MIYIILSSILMNYYQKYLKYKNKYLILKKQLGGDLTNVNIYYNGSKIDGVNLSDLDEDDSTNYLKGRIVQYLNSPERNEVFKDIRTVSQDNIVLYVGTKQNLASKIKRESQIKNNTNYSFSLEHITPIKLPTEIKAGFESLVEGKNGKPLIKSIDGSEYNGDIADGIPHGYGTKTRLNGYKYEGQFYEGQIKGLGTETYSFDYSYSGGFKNGLYDGYGVMKFHGYQIEGKFSMGLRNGNFTERRPDGVTIESQYVDDMRHGHHTERLPDGVTIESQYVDGICHGHQKITDQDNKLIFEGEINMGKRIRGRETLQSGNIYDGEFDGEYFNGHGMIKTYDGKIIFDGQYLMDQKIRGTQYLSDGIYEGEFKNEEYEGKGKLTYNDGYNFEGDFKDDFKDGFGIETLPNGNRYEGEFKDDIKNGHGIFTKLDGFRYDGQFKNDKIDYGHPEPIVNRSIYEIFHVFLGLQNDKRAELYLHILEDEYQNNNEVKITNHVYGYLMENNINDKLKNKYFVNATSLDPEEVNPEWNNFRANLETRLANKTLHDFKSSGNDIDGEHILSFIKSTTNIFIQKVIQAHLISLSDADLSNPTTWANATNFKFKSDFNDIFGDIVNVGINIKPEPKSFSYRTSTSGDIITEYGSLV